MSDDKVPNGEEHPPVEPKPEAGETADTDIDSDGTDGEPDTPESNDSPSVDANASPGETEDTDVDEDTSAAGDDSPSDSELKDVYERIASRILNEKLGIKLEDNGKVDFDAVDQEAFQAKSKEITVALLAAFSEIAKVRQQSKAGLDEDAMAANAKRVEAKIAAFLDRVNSDPGDFGAMVKDFGTRLKAFVNSKRDPEPIAEPSEDSVDLSQRIIQLVKSVGENFEEGRAKYREEHPDESGREMPTIEFGGTKLGGSLADVIDLAKVRERIAAKDGIGAKITNSLQSTLTNIIENQLTSGGSNINLNIDQDFFREHGQGILNDMVNKLAEKISNPKLEITLPAQSNASPSDSDTDGDDKPDGKEEEGSKLKVQVNFNLSNLLSNLFTRKAPASAPTEPPTHLRPVEPIDEDE